MLVIYFLRRFSLRFSLVFIVLVPLFASGDLIVRLAGVPFSCQILKLLGFMLPLVCLFAIPIATSLAVGLTIGTVFSNGESLFFKCFPAGRYALEGSVLIFSIILFICYIPFVLRWAPESYWSGKRFLINAAQQQIENLPAQQFHSIGSQCTIFFKENNSSFRDVLIMVRERGLSRESEPVKNNKKYLVTAKSGILKRDGDNEGFLHLRDGVIYNNGSIANGKKQADCIATFKLLEIAFEKLFFKNGGTNKNKNVKFLTWDELRKANDSILIFREIHKRVAQILWQLLLPFLIFWALMILGKEKSNILLSLMMSGGLFLFSYLSINTAYYLLSGSIFTTIIFYSIPTGLAIILYSAYKKFWG